MKYRLLALCGASILLASCTVDDAVTGLTNEDTAINVLANDIQPSGLSAVLVDSAGLSGVTLDTDGNLFIPAGNIAGNYVLSYAACLKRRSNVCFPGAVNVVLEDGVSEPILASVEVKAADISSFSLEEIGIPANSFIVAGQGDLDDGSPEYLIDNGLLFIGSPSDLGEEQVFTVKLDDESGQKSEIELTVNSSRPSEIITFAESSGEDDGFIFEESVPLLISGLGSLNALGGQDLVFSADSDVQIIPEFSSITLSFNVKSLGGGGLEGETSTLPIDTVGFQIFDIKDSFIFDPNTNEFSISREGIEEILETIPAGSFDISINLVSEDFEFAENYSFTSLKAQASLIGQIIDANGSPLSGQNVDSLQVAIVGSDSQSRQVVSVDANGRFGFDRLSTEGYEFTIMDLNYPDFFTSFVGVFGDTTEVNVSIPYTPEVFDGASEDATASSKLTLQKSNITNLKINSQNGTPPIRDRSLNQKFENGIALQKIDSSIEGCGVEADGGTYYTTASAGEGVSETCNIDFSAAEGVTGVEIEVEVQTDEFPEFTTEQSEFDDRWKYSFAAKNSSPDSQAFFQEDGRVNQTHATTRTITTANSCVQIAVDENGVAADTIKLIGSISATNIGDSIIPTKVSVKITEECGDLLIEDVVIASPNSTNYDVIKPIVLRKKANIDGRYISIPTKSPDGAEVSLPMTIKYSPKEAEISEATLSVIRNGSIIATSSNFLGTTSASNGEIELESLVIPELSGVTLSDDRISLSVQLKGMINGEESLTELGNINVKFDDENSFNPLFLAENEILDRRYGQRGPEEGDDNWARKSTIDWLRGNTYLFNDISAQHVAQRDLSKVPDCPLNSPNGSILCHSTHSDGTAIDLRYVIPAGTFPNGGVTSENLGMVSDALAEKNANNGITAKQEVLAKWIKDNRSAIEKAAPQARQIYFANGVLGNALRAGKYSDNTDILNLPFTPPPPANPADPIPTAPAIGIWTKQPLISDPSKGHSNHWHIALKE